ncbi:MAG: ABC transporter substrate-binding protein [Candidatus Thorarchaeota archaeon]
MNKNNTKRVIALCLAFAFLFMAVSPMFAHAQTMDLGHEKTGPFLERIVYDVIEDEATQILAIQNNQIDMLDSQLNTIYLPVLEAADNIGIEQNLRNGFGIISINTQSWPLNYTALRRAIAFAADKEAISDQVWDGFSVPQDSYIPQTNPWSIEGTLPYTYYAEDLVTARQVLADGGFVDLDDDGFVEAPNGEAFDILVECAISSPQAIEVGQIVAASMVAAGIDARSEPTDFYDYLQRLYHHGDYQMVFYGNTWGNFDVDQLEEFNSAYITESFLNEWNFVNATYDALIPQLMEESDPDLVRAAAEEMQRILVYESPFIICYENTQFWAYRTDRFEGFVPDELAGLAGYWTLYKTHLKEGEGGPYGGTLRTSNSLDIDSFNFMTSTSGYSQYINNMMWDSLGVVDGEGNDMLWLAESYTIETHDDNAAIPDGYTRYTFDILQNATWTDGMPLTGEDVAFSMNFLRDAPGTIYSADLRQMTAAYSTTTYQVVIEFGSESYWNFHMFFYKPILPKHIFQGWLNTWNQWNPIPPTDAMVTSGPYNVSEYIAGEFTEMTYNPNFFYGPDRGDEPPTPTPTTGPDLTMAIVAGAVGAAVVILIGGYVLLRQR